MKASESVEQLQLDANRLHLARHDLYEAAAYLRLLIARLAHAADDGPEAQDPAPAFLIAFIVVYSRPFMKSWSQGSATAKVTPADIGLFDDQPYLEPIHDLVIRARDKMVAHSDWEFRNARLEESDSSSGVVRSYRSHHYPSDFNPADLKRLVDHVEAELNFKAHALDVKVGKLRRKDEG